MFAEGLHVNEAPGMDLLADEDGCWRDLLTRAEGGEDEVDEDEGRDAVDPEGESTEEARRPVRRRRGKREPAWRVDAGPIDHRSRCVAAFCGRY